MVCYVVHASAYRRILGENQLSRPIGSNLRNLSLIKLTNKQSDEHDLVTQKKRKIAFTNRPLISESDTSLSIIYHAVYKRVGRKVHGQVRNMRYCKIRGRSYTMDRLKRQEPKLPVTDGRLQRFAFSHHFRISVTRQPLDPTSA